MRILGDSAGGRWRGDGGSNYELCKLDVKYPNLLKRRLKFAPDRDRVCAAPDRSATQLAYWQVLCTCMATRAAAGDVRGARRRGHVDLATGGDADQYGRHQRPSRRTARRRRRAADHGKSSAVTGCLVVLAPSQRHPAAERPGVGRATHRPSLAFYREVRGRSRGGNSHGTQRESSTGPQRQSGGSPRPEARLAWRPLRLPGDKLPID